MTRVTGAGFRELTVGPVILYTGIFNVWKEKNERLRGDQSRGERGVGRVVGGAVLFIAMGEQCVKSNSNLQQRLNKCLVVDGIGLVELSYVPLMKVPCLVVELPTKGPVVLVPALVRAVSLAAKAPSLAVPLEGADVAVTPKAIKILAAVPSGASEAAHA